MVNCGRLCANASMDFVVEKEFYARVNENSWDGTMKENGRTSERLYSDIAHAEQGMGKDMKIVFSVQSEFI